MVRNRKLGGRIFDFWWRRVEKGWRREGRLLKQSGLGGRQIAGLISMLVGVAVWMSIFNAGMGPGIILSYSLMMALAISWASFFSSPVVFVLSYLLVVMRSQAIDQMVAGEWVAGLVILGIAAYVYVEAK